MTTRLLNPVGLALASAIMSNAWAGTLPDYQAIIIEPWNDAYMFSFSAATSINNLNQVTGGATYDAGGNGAMFLWTQETGKTVIEIAGPINDNGIIVSTGTMRLPDGTLLSFEDLGNPSDINNSEVVVGPRIICMSGSDAKVWDEVNGVRSLFQDYGVVAAFASSAINDHNEIVGVRSWTDECGDLEAFYFNLNTLEHIDIHAELLGTSSGITRAWDVNNHGNVLGEGPWGGTVQPFIWHRNTGFRHVAIPENTDPMDVHYGSINNHDVIVGAARINNDVWKAIIWDGQRGARDLNEIVELPPNITLDRAIQINDNGWIICSALEGVWSPGLAVVLIPTGNNGDLDANGALTPADHAMFCAAIGTSEGEPGYSAQADLNADGTIDHLDQAIFNQAVPSCTTDVVSTTTFQPPGDNVTDGADLAFLLGAWGNQASCADLVSSKTFAPPPDGVVDGADLALLLGAWGTCE